MKPLLSMICYNRRDESVVTLRALHETGALEQATCLIQDNGSTDDTRRAISRELYYTLRDHEVTFQRLEENIGCPAALNRALQTRLPGQHFIKVDNDVVLETPGWVDLLCQFLDEHPDVALVSPWYEELETANQGRIVERYDTWWQIFPVIGHCVLHRGEFLDQVGYFDVLDRNHLYGFEDNLMAHRAGAMGYKCAVDLRVRLRNIQRKNSLDGAFHRGESREAHIARLRPEYERRVALVHKLKEAYYVTLDGQCYHRQAEPWPFFGGERRKGAMA